MHADGKGGFAYGNNIGDFDLSICSMTNITAVSSGSMIYSVSN